MESKLFSGHRDLQIFLNTEIWRSLPKCRILQFSAEIILTRKYDSINGKAVVKVAVINNIITVVDITDILFVLVIIY